MDFFSLKVVKKAVELPGETVVYTVRRIGSRLLPPLGDDVTTTAIDFEDDEFSRLRYSASESE